MVRKPKNKRPPSARTGLPKGAAGAAAARLGPPPPRRGLVLAVCAGLLVAVAVVFGQTLQHGFVNFDDKAYVSENPMVYGGLTARGIAWAFTHSHGSNWHPLSSMSHMLDCELYGLEKPWGHHLTSVVLHAATAILLFLVLLRMTGGLWPSAFVAVVFAIHPLRAESVAWISERKDVLSGLFFMLTLWAYVGYVRKPFSRLRYLGVAAFFALGLMAKPMLVTLPFVLLLLDYWPLGRFQGAGLGGGAGGRRWVAVRLVVEKIPLAALAIGSCVATVWAQGTVIIPVAAAPLSLRIMNALDSYVAYIGQTCCPVGLAAFYPFPLVDATLPWKAAAAAVVLGGISAAALAWRRACPYLAVGWLWYLGMLVPVIGLVQVGGQAMADRYTYLPQIGLLLAVAWGVADFVRSRPGFRRVAAVAAALAVTVLAACACQQTSYWRDDQSLWERALEVTSPQRPGRGFARLRPEGAWATSTTRSNITSAALRINPRAYLAHYNLALAYTAQRRVKDAIAQYESALRIEPAFAEAHNNLGNLLVGQGKLDEAMKHHRKTVDIDPLSVHGNIGLGTDFALRGHFDEAADYFGKAVDIDRGSADAHLLLANALADGGQPDKAIPHFQEAIRLHPDDPRPLGRLAWLLATSPDASLRDGFKAVELAQRAARLSGGSEPGFLDTLAAAYAEAGRFPEAVKTAEEARTLAAQRGNRALADRLAAHIKLYRAGTPFRDAAGVPAKRPFRS